MKIIKQYLVRKKLLALIHVQICLSMGSDGCVEIYNCTFYTLKWRTVNYF